MSIPMILASKSQPRRDVLYAAGNLPDHRVSHVDEPAALEKAAAERGVTVDQLNVEQRVMIWPRPKRRPCIRRTAMSPTRPRARRASA